MDFEKLNRYDDWWTTSNVKASLLMPYRRPLFNQLLEYLKDRQILLIWGLRRVGKTVLLYQLIQELLNTKVQPYNILYFSFDEESATIDDLLETYQTKVLKKGFDEAERIYIFLDEIQKVKDWQSKIKIYYDLYPNLKFFLSGSASISLQKQSKESLAGRMYDFLLEPLSFNEFVQLKGMEIEKTRLELYQSSVVPLFHDYLRKGGFPEIIEATNDDKIRTYIKDTIIEKIVYKDLPVEFGLKDIKLLNILIRMVAESPGMIVNYDRLARDLNRTKRTIMNYIGYLEYALLIRLVSNYRAGFLISSRKQRKIYLNNTAVAFAFVTNYYSDQFLEKLAENLVIIHADVSHYYRDSYEIDAILKIDNLILPIEVKYGRVDQKGMKKFLTKFHNEKGIIITRDLFRQDSFNKKIIKLIPLWAFLLMEIGELYDK